MKILYAASNDYNGKIQLDRFLQHIDRNIFNIKISAYRNFYPECSVDWTLNCLSNNDVVKLTNNSYIEIYLDQVSKFNPDLIISDLEINTSYVAAQLNIKLWHVSSKLNNFAMLPIYKMHMGLHKYYIDLFKSHKYIKDLINIANKNYIYSHWGDILEAPTTKEGFEWIRPYYAIGKYSEPCKHNIIAINNCNNPEMLKYLKNKQDTVLFSHNPESKYNGFISKSINDTLEYICNVYNSNTLVCDGSASLVADAVYNKKRLIIEPNKRNIECLFNYLMYQNIFNYLITDGVIEPIDLNIKPNVKFLHEHLEELIK